MRTVVSVIWNEPPCTYVNILESLLSLSNNIKIFVFFLAFYIFPAVEVRKTCIFTAEKPQLKLIRFQNYKHCCLINTWSDKALNGTVVNRALSPLHGGSLKILLTVLLKNVEKKQIIKVSLKKYHFEIIVTRKIIKFVS